MGNMYVVVVMAYYLWMQTDDLHSEDMSFLRAYRSKQDTP